VRRHAPNVLGLDTSKACVRSRAYANLVIGKLRIHVSPGVSLTHISTYWKIYVNKQLATPVFSLAVTPSNLQANPPRYRELRMAQPVELKVYDLSGGLAAALSLQLLGRQVRVPVQMSTPQEDNLDRN
jgi:hypothetical protein